MATLPVAMHCQPAEPQRSHVYMLYTFRLQSWRASCGYMQAAILCLQHCCRDSIVCGGPQLVSHTHGDKRAGSSSPAERLNKVRRCRLYCQASVSGSGGSGGGKGLGGGGSGGGDGGMSGSSGLGGLWALYLRALEARPLVTRCATSGILNGIGDIAGQRLFSDEPFDWLRLAKFTFLVRKHIENCVVKGSDLSCVSVFSS